MRLRQSFIYFRRFIRIHSVESVRNCVGPASTDIFGNRFRIQLAARLLEPLSKMFGSFKDRVWKGNGNFHARKVSPQYDHGNTH